MGNGPTNIIERKEKDMIRKSIRNIGVVTYPEPNIPNSSTVRIFLPNFLNILQPLCDNIYVITGNLVFDGDVQVLKIKTDANKESLLIRLFKYIITRLKIAIKLSKILSKVDAVIFFSGHPMVESALLTKLRRKKVSIHLIGLSSKSSEAAFTKGISRIIPYILRLLGFLYFRLADQIAVESRSIIQFHDLERYENKIVVNGALYIDLALFKPKIEVMERKNVIGYIGRLSPVKGVTNFVKAIPLISKERDDLEFLIVGDGPLLNEIKNKLKNKESYDKVELTGWIPHNELSDCLNELKLLVLPSNTEGLPNIVLEAMACGTPVLATPVGGVPDVIKDGKTGFIMEGNMPECITRNVIRALNHPDLEKITKNACALIETEYTYEAAVERYRKILENI